LTPNHPNGRWAEILNADHPLSILGDNEMVLADIDKISESVQFLEQQQQHLLQQVKKKGSRSAKNS
jgi:hypothetical protein